ncbi:MAG: hypothetical protein AABW99_04110 [archaeon]
MRFSLLLPIAFALLLVCTIATAAEPLNRVYIKSHAVSPAQITAGESTRLNLSIAWQDLGVPFQDITYDITLVRIGSPESPQIQIHGTITPANSSGAQESTNEIITTTYFPPGEYRLATLVYYGNDPKPVDLASRIIFIGKQSTPIPDLNGAAIVLAALAAFFILRRNN